MTSAMAHFPHIHEKTICSFGNQQTICRPSHPSQLILATTNKVIAPIITESGSCNMAYCLLRPAVIDRQTGKHNQNHHRNWHDELFVRHINHNQTKANEIKANQTTSSLF
jgi:hypothetical protein